MLTRFFCLPPVLLAAVVALASAGVAAQSGDKPSEKKELSDAERAKRDAERVFSFIKFHTVKPAAPQPAPPAPRPAAVRKVPSAPTPAPVAAAPEEPAKQAAPLTPTAAAPSPSVNAAPVAALGASEPQATPAPTAVDAPLLPTEPPPAPEPEEVPLRLIQYTEPDMSPQVMAALNSAQMVVPVRFTVQPNGRVSAAQALGSAPRRVALAAVRAVQQWRFEPIPAVREVDVEIAFRAGE